MDHVCVSDEREGAERREFKGIRASLAAPVPEGESEYVLVLVNDDDNGFGWGLGTEFANLKHLGDGRYGA